MMAHKRESVGMHDEARQVLSVRLLKFLALNEIGISAISTFNTDYIFTMETVIEGQKKVREN